MSKNTRSVRFGALTLLATVTVLSGLSLSGLGGLSAQAAGINPTISPSEVNVSTTGNIVLVFTPATPIVNNSTITVVYPNTYSGGASLTSADITVTGTNITAASTSNITATGFTSTLTTTGNVTTPVTITIGGANKLTTPVAAGNYAFSIVTSVGDTGAVLQYVGDANDVQVRAFVPTNLSFVIRNAADTDNTNTCDLGSLSTTAVASCAYRLKVGTNAANGYTIQVKTTGNLTNGVQGFANAAAGAGGTGGTNIVAGTERYGARITKGNITNGTTSLAAAYDAGATNSVSYVNTVAANLVVATGPNAPAASNDVTNTTLVTHNAAISPNTTPGNYVQTVTYTVNPAF